MLLLLVNKVVLSQQIQIYTCLYDCSPMKFCLFYRLARVRAKSIGRLINITLEIPLSQGAYTVKKSVDFTVKYLATISISSYFYGCMLVEHFWKSRYDRVKKTFENTFVGFNGYMTKCNAYLFAAVLCPIPENVYGRP